MEISGSVCIKLRIRKAEIWYDSELLLFCMIWCHSPQVSEKRNFFLAPLAKGPIHMNVGR